MVQLLNSIPSAQTLENSRLPLIDRDRTALSQSSGIAFPTINLEIGMPCHRTDEMKLYVLESTGPDVWTLVFDFNKTVLMMEDADALYLLEANNLSDLDNASTARTNLGLGSLAVKNTVIAGDIATSAVTGPKLAVDAVTQTKIVNNAVSLTKMADIATATLLGRSAAGTGDPQALSKASALSLLNVADGAEVNPIVVSQGDAQAGTATDERTWTAERVKQAIVALGASSGLTSVQVFTGTGTWTKPAGITRVLVEIVGGGGGGGGTAGTGTSGSGGGGGGYAKMLVTNPGATEAVTVGPGGPGNTGTGGTSSFGAHASATGGGPGAPHPDPLGGTGGQGASPHLAVKGQGGGGSNASGGDSSTSGTGGNSALGGGGAGRGANTFGNGEDGGQWGGGGSGASRTTGGVGNGGNGFQGIVIIWEYK